MNTLSIRNIYLYLFALIGLIISTIGAVQLVNLGLRTYVFTGADTYYTYPAAKPVPTSGTTTAASQEPSQAEIDTFNRNQQAANRQRDAAQAFAMLLIGIPLYSYHWRVIKKEKETQ